MILPDEKTRLECGILEPIVATKGKIYLQPHARSWTDCIIDKIFKNTEIVKFITTALKNILNLVK